MTGPARDARPLPASTPLGATRPAAADPVGQAHYRAAFRHYAAGVVVVTAGTGDRPVGLTVTSLASVSLDPPLVSFALSTASSSWPVVAASASVVVNFLDADQHPLATLFATRGATRFAPPTRWSVLPTGEPVLDDSPGHLRAVVERRVPAGDHHLVVARVVEVELRRAYEPLVYHHGHYGAVLPIDGG